MHRESDSITSLKGIGEKSSQALRKAGVESIGDLLMHLPLRYDNYSFPVNVVPELTGHVIAFSARLATSPLIRRKGSLSIITATASADGIPVNLAWFHMPYIRNRLHKGEQYVFRGKLLRNRYGYSMDQAMVFSSDEYDRMAGSLWPVYRLSEGITTGKLRTAIADAFTDLVPDEDFIPDILRDKYGLGDRLECLKSMHFPKDHESLIPARRRLVFEEFLLFILAVRALKTENKASANGYVIRDNSDADRLIQSLPYELTGAQRRVLDDIRRDTSGPLLMNRLIQGDVGSGKTIVAILSLISAAQNGYQGALMAPTEVLARQHFENISRMLREYSLPYRAVLLTGSMSAGEKRSVYEDIAAHGADIIVGTHALIQKGVTYDRLGLVVTDEQHRFGVRQRDTLSDKGGAPHVIVMSATPIPRTLAIILYGDLDISVIDELPAHRLPIKNCVVGQNYRARAYDFIRDQVRLGHQAYVICPKVEEGEEDEGENVVDYTDKLREALPPYIRVEYLHGRMKAAEKNLIMEEFLVNRIQVLVSTTVIEVGVDVPNATVMMIEDAERFGLAQLHQLRGRVGRGSSQSYCIFINGSGDPEKQQRLDVLNHSNDGFYIAGEDLKLRGPGDIFGLRQSGALSFALGDIFTDSRILSEAAEAADYVLAHKGSFPLLERKLDSYMSDSLDHLSL
ncbi:MAG: ATP-dependent DNA helicase RecG [Lachnospiraceae bacterium]|nr:ATP-dependent DNA helicase RecG [Lachnospiraceae bacterium]